MHCRVHPDSIGRGQRVPRSRCGGFGSGNAYVKSSSNACHGPFSRISKRPKRPLFEILFEIRGWIETIHPKLAARRHTTCISCHECFKQEGARACWQDTAVSQEGDRTSPTSSYASAVGTARRRSQQERQKK
mmetsp:Transcript_51367/g.82124  ORF Transcript_51367/g.82124 Transcript_51367/m.82124 type:complete len:132 (+) Transcript_51367:371-766(+)